MSNLSDRRARAQQAIWQEFDRMVNNSTRTLLESFMAEERDSFLQCGAYQRDKARRGYRNGYFQRQLQTRYGTFKLRVPRVRDCPAPFRSLTFDRYQRRSRRIDRIIRHWVAAGQSTRLVEQSLRECFGNLISAATVSRVIAKVDAELASFHRRGLDRGYRVLFLDAKHGYLCPRQKGSKKKKAVLLSAWAIRWDGREELVDFRAYAGEENEACWSAFLTDLEGRGLRRRDRFDQPLELIVGDGDAGLEAALRLVYPQVPRQRCLFHKLRNLTGHLLDKSNRKAILASASAVYRQITRPAEAQAKLRGWVEQWRYLEPAAVRIFQQDFQRTLTYLNLPPRMWRRCRTTNPIERLHAEMEKVTKHIGAWQNLPSWERHIWLLWRQLKASGYAPTKPNPLFTQNS